MRGKKTSLFVAVATALSLVSVGFAANNVTDRV